MELLAVLAVKKKETFVSPKGNSWSEPSLTDYDESKVKEKKFTS